MGTTHLIRTERGVTLAELMVALVVLSVGVFAIGSLFPAGSRGQQRDRLMTAANLYAQQKLEEVQSKPWTDPEMSLGRHPAGTATEDLGDTGVWHRWYTVSAMTAPLDNLRKVTVSVSWDGLPPDTLSVTTYVRR